MKLALKYSLVIAFLYFVVKAFGAEDALVNFIFLGKLPYFEIYLGFWSYLITALPLVWIVYNILSSGNADRINRHLNSNQPHSQTIADNNPWIETRSPEPTSAASAKSADELDMITL